MPGDERRLYNLDPGSSAYDFRLEEVKREIRAGAVQFEQQLCALAEITPEKLHEFLESRTIGEVHAAINAWGPGFESHLDQIGLGEPEDPRAPGWLVTWERAKEAREKRGAGE